MTLLEQSRARYLRAPRFVVGEDGIALVCLAWEGGVERALSWAIDAEGNLREPPQEASFTEVADDSDSDGRYEVRVERDAGSTRVVLSRKGGEDVTVWEAFGTAAAPAVRAAPDGAWVAFHHDVREDSGQPDVVKWIALRHVGQDGIVRAPIAPMLGRDRDATGEEQGFEFPSLVLSPDGGISLFGRGSHQFFRQDLDASGFSARVPLGDGSWGCRGRHVAAVVLGDGSVLTARREKAGIVVARLGAPPRSAPALERTEVTVSAPRKRASPRERRAPDGRLTLFGDIHQHSAHSDGCGTADEPYLRARWRYGDDFCALTDHESFLGKRIGPGEWEHLQRVADAHHDEGAFVTLFAYEWTGAKHPGPGHKVVYMPTRGAPIVSRDDEPTGAGMLARVRALGGFAVPHHVGWTGADESAHDPEVQPVWEICSCHGCYEHADHPPGQRGDLRDQMVDAVLRRGRRFGFIACSDGHGLLHHHGVARKRDPFRTGLTAVQSEARTRASILAAIRERRCYATSGAKILLDLRANGAPMGSVVAGATELQVQARCEGTASLRSLSLIGPDGVLAQVSGDGSPLASLEAVVRAPYVYARAEQVDGEMAWSSPIWRD